MTQDFIVNFAMEAIRVGLLVSAPMLAFGLIAGLVVSVFQAATSIPDLTLTFIPKILAVFFALILFLPWLVHTMTGFASNVFTNFPSYIG